MSKKGREKKGSSTVSPVREPPTQTTGGFDYTALIPKNIDERSKELLQRFLCNQLQTDKERDEALMIFAQALLNEHGELAVEGRAPPVLPQQAAPAAPPIQKAPLLSTPPPVTVPEVQVAQPKPSRFDEATSDSGEPVPHASCLSEERTRINVGWLAAPADCDPAFDKDVATYSQRLGCQLYNFVTYPVGGAERGFWKPTGPDTEPPKIDLPDLQLQNHLWETYVNGQVSWWIDCDSKDEWLAELSEKELVKELNYIIYLGLRSVVIRLQHARSPRLARILRKWLWTKHSNLAFWICLPSSCDGLQFDEGDDRDLWSVWADFRQSCNNYSINKLTVGIRLGDSVDDEFIEKRLLDRWKAEPLCVFWIDSDAFLCDEQTSLAMLPAAHAHLLTTMWASDDCRILVRGKESNPVPDQVRIEMCQAVRRCVQKLPKAPADPGFLSSVDYMDVLQAPLQPLAENLDSAVYNTFEQDPIKYDRYRQAVESALLDLCGTKAMPTDLVLYVLGAGRGPLVSASLEAEQNFNRVFRQGVPKLKMRVFVVEKNVNAIVTLNYCNQRGWKNRCTIVESDMRKLPEKAAEMGLPKPDIIVSELLGSFGDNELSCECLDGVTPILKPTTISIPSSYTSYAAPIHSINLHQGILAAGASYWNSGIPGQGRQGPEEQPDGRWKQNVPQGQRVANLDQIYVVFLRSFCPLGIPKPVFTFDHPNFENKSNCRSARIPFTMDRTCDIMGFAGYFHMTLYKEIYLSIVPETFSKGMISWFPALIPLRELFRAKEGQQIHFCIDRKIDDTGVWYEWSVEYEEGGETKRTVIQNKDGQSYYMRLQS